MNNTIIGVDLAKEVIQVCIYTNKSVRSNTEMTTREFLIFLANLKSATVIFEACSTSNYWKQKATSLGHDARLICPKLVHSVRQNQKTDKNDALAVVQAALLPDVNFISGKNIEQQQLQSIMRFRELAIKQKTALGNQLKSLLLELNIRVSNRDGGLKGVIQATLEDGENDLSFEFRSALQMAWTQYRGLIKSIVHYEEVLANISTQHTECKRLLQLEGVSTINAVNLYIALGCQPELFHKGKEASACIGLTPVQHSTGGKVKLGSIGKYVKNSMLRSNLIVGAMSAINRIMTREAVTQKEAWIQALVARRGKRCAAVALANKTVRTAFAMLTQGTEYKAVLITA
ncbi:IS110 family transposase [Colwellia sp. RSH04]|uniref:IS110 family transposase n=1 Tax=Colwellia sp. RSH04 TaxID=2305464 RepID=UPI000E57CFE9|nr:IS110 family transposase [Colwellia sp. RSH04]RHW75314.1 IS110 family transposase [Colwellia sp. RSH04]